MSLKLISDPVAMAVTIEEARTAARINGTDHDAELEMHVRALTETVEHETGRAIISQTWRLTLDGFPDAIRLPAPPVASVTSVKYIDPDGVLQTLEPADYTVDTELEPAFITPAPGCAWPETDDRINAVTVVAVCGYGPTAATTPKALKGYILGKLWEIYAPPGTEKNEDLDKRLWRYKVY